MLLMLAFVLLAVAAASSHQRECVSMEYVNLASAVQQSLRSSSLLMINAGSEDELQDELCMCKMSRELSSAYVLSHNMHMGKLARAAQYYKGKSVQPLFVVMLKSLQELHRFAEMTKTYDMATHTWLVIFCQSSVRSFNNYCRRPRENLFNLVISSKMMVKCDDDTILREWYSIDGKTLHTYDYGVWSDADNRMMQLSDDTFYARRSDFKGVALKVSAVKDDMPWGEGNSTMDGFFGMVLHELSILMNFSVQVHSIESSYGNYNQSTKRWSGVIGQLVDGQVDIGVGELTITRQRSDVIDFTTPCMFTWSDIYIKRPDMSNVDWSAYVKAFHKDIWLIIMAMLIITPILLAFMWKVIRGYAVSDRLGEEYLCVWGIYCQKPLTDFPKASSLRLAYISIFMSSLVLFAVYSAYLTSYLTLFKPTLPFDTFDGFVRDGTFRLLVLRRSSNHDLFTRKQASIFRQMGKLLESENKLPTDLLQAVKQVCKDRAVLYTNQLLVDKIQRYSPCQLMPLTIGRLDNVGFALVKNSPYTPIFNYNLKSLRALGVIERQKRRYFQPLDEDKLSYLPVEFYEVIPLLAILGFAIAIASVLLVCESCLCNKKQALILAR